MLSFVLRHVAGDKGAQDPCPNTQVPLINKGCAAALRAEMSKRILELVHASSSKEMGMRGVCVCVHAHPVIPNTKHGRTLSATLFLSYIVTD